MGHLSPGAHPMTEWLATSGDPKLLINAEPGAILTGPMFETARGFRNQAQVTVQGSHFIQEDSGSRSAGRS
jgi:haloalkane dehalogenase